MPKKPIRPQPLPEVGQRLEFYPQDSFIPPTLEREIRKYESDRNANFKEKWDKRRDVILKKYDKKPEKLKTLLDKHEKEMAQDWVKFATETRTTKDKVVANFARELKIEKLEDQDFQIPQKGRWITFPLCGPDDAEGDKANGDAVTITWTANNTTHTATYYKITCWFGTLDYDASLVTVPVDPSLESQDKRKLLTVEPLGDDSSYDPEAEPAPEPEKPSEDLATTSPETPATSTPIQTETPSTQKWKPVVRLNAFGETALFIAAEFIEPRYQGAPHLRHLHLRDKFPPGTRWGYLRLDQAFHYGQNYDNPTYRYLVYHPFIRPRHIPQRSFADNITLTTALTMAESAANSGNTYVASGGAAIGGIVKLIAACQLHPLRQFDPLEADEMLYNVSQEIEKREKAWNPEPTLLQQTEQVLQTTAQIVASVSTEAPPPEIGLSNGKESGPDPTVTDPSDPEGEKPTAYQDPELPDFTIGAEVLLANATDVIKKALTLPPQDQQDTAQTYLDLDEEETVMPPLRVGIIDHPVYGRMKVRLPPIVHEPSQPVVNEPQPEPNALQQLQGGNKAARTNLGLEQKPGEGQTPVSNPGHQKWKGPGKEVTMPSNFKGGRRIVKGRG
ncbi:hypothetical protein ACHAPT_008991 [Fusarium lateritium]